MQKIQAVKQDYVLTRAAQQEVDAWIAFCSPSKVTEPAEEGGVGVTSSSLKGMPQVTSAAPTQSVGLTVHGRTGCSDILQR
jgi:hypothetical protein